MDRRRSNTSRQEPVVRPLLNRLIDPQASSASARSQREAIQRDLEDLLNTRWRCKSWPPQYEELEQSVVNYGIPDFTGTSFDNPLSQRDFRMIITRAISRFEPRLQNVKVSLMAGADAGSAETRTLRFKIEAMLQSDEGWRDVAYETLMNPTDSTFTVKRAER